MDKMHTSQSSLEHLVAHYRYLWEMSASGGLLCVFGCLSIVPFLIDTAALSIGHNNGSPWTGGQYVFPSVIQIIGTVIGVAYGLTGIVTGFLTAVFNYGSEKMSLVAILITLGAWWTFFAATIAPIAFAADRFKADGTGAGQSFIPADYNPTEMEVQAVGTLAALCMTSYAASLIGALTFFQFQQWRFQKGLFSVYNASYYRSRATYYGFLQLLAGVVQLALGAFCIKNYDNELHNNKFAAPITAGIFVVTYPSISIIVGILQIVLGIWIMARPNPNPNPTSSASTSSTFQLSPFYAYAIFVYLIEMALQNLAQIATSDAAGVAPVAAVMAMFITGQALIPLYLDHKANTTPENVSDEAYLAVLNADDRTVISISSSGNHMPGNKTVGGGADMTTPAEHVA